VPGDDDGLHVGNTIPFNSLRAALGRRLPPRVRVVNAELRRFARPRYLELGIDTGVLFLHVRAHRKVGVDPQSRVPRWKWYLHPNTLIRGSYFRTTSDRFFDALDPSAGFEVIFVDGEHSFAQSRRDVERALAHLAPDGVILIHDCNPPTAGAASPDSADAGGGPWCGEVWKTIIELRATRPELSVRTLDADFGIGVVRRGHGARLELTPAAIDSMAYADLERDRAGLLGLVPVPGVGAEPGVSGPAC
jgi:hypothetical protein